MVVGDTELAVASSRTATTFTSRLLHQCNGKSRCERYEASGQERTGGSSWCRTEDDLRAELDRLKRRQVQSDAILDALSSGNETEMYNMVAQGLMDATTTREAIFCKLVQVKACGTSERSTPNSQPATDSDTHTPLVSCLHCRGILDTRSSIGNSQVDVSATSGQLPSVEKAKVLRAADR